MTYFDTSAMIRAWRLGKVPEGVTRGHSVAEFYCVLTGPGLKPLQEGRTVSYVLSPGEAAEAAAEVFAKMKFHEVSGKEALETLPGAAEAHEIGKNIHDWMHCEAASLAECSQIATLNARDFGRMTSLKVVPPEEAF